jgi:hypothetical protein
MGGSCSAYGGEVLCVLVYNCFLAFYHYFTNLISFLTLNIMSHVIIRSMF